LGRKFYRATSSVTAILRMAPRSPGACKPWAFATGRSRRAHRGRTVMLNGWVNYWTLTFVALRSERHGTLWRVLEGVFSKRDHEFESGFLQRRVRKPSVPRERSGSLQSAAVMHTKGAGGPIENTASVDASGLRVHWPRW
jgi:hypothetical protein